MKVLVFDVHGRSRHRDPRGIHQPTFLLHHGVIGHADEPAVDRAVNGEREGLNFDLNRLSFLDEPDVFVFHPRFHIQLRCLRHDHHELLSRRDHPADRMDGQLLDDSIDRRRQGLKVGALSRFDGFLLQGGRLGFGRRQFRLACLLKL